MATENSYGLDNENIMNSLTTNGKSDVRDEDELELENVDEPRKERSGESLSFRGKLRDHVYRRKFLYSMCMAASSVALGMSDIQHGPTFMDIQIITNTDLETASTFFTASKAGYLTGSIATGLIYNKVSTPMLIFILTLLHGTSNVFLPYCTPFVAMMAIRFASSAFCGGTNTGLTSEHMTLWGSGANSILQFMHFSYSFGGVIAPLIAEPFLAEKMSLDKTINETILNVSISTHSADISDIQKPPHSSVEYVFYITGIFTLLTACPFIYIYFFKRGEKTKENAEKRKFSRSGVPFPILMIMLCGIFLFNFTYCCVEHTFFAYLMTFLVEEYDSVSKSKGAFVTAIGWAAFAVGRFLMIFVTKMFSTVQILLILTTSMAISFSAFTLFADFGIVEALIVVTAIVSLALSGVFPAGIAWTEQEMFPVTGIISSCVFVSGSLGSMVNPLILGNLMEERTNMWFCYLLLIQTVIMYSTFIILLVFSRCYVDKKYGSLASTQSKEINVPKVLEGDDSQNAEAQNKLLQ